MVVVRGHRVPGRTVRRCHLLWKWDGWLGGGRVPFGVSVHSGTVMWQEHDAEGEFKVNKRVQTCYWSGIYALEWSALLCLFGLD